MCNTDTDGITLLKKNMNEKPVMHKKNGESRWEIMINA